MDSQLPPDNNPPPQPAAPTPPPPPSFVAPPPLIAPYAAQRAPRRGSGWKVFAIILLVFLVLSVMLNFGSFMSSISGGKIGTTHSYGPMLEEVTIRSTSARSKIAVIPVEGIITGEAVDGGGFSMVSIIKAQLKRAQNDDDVKAVLLKVNSPGGEVLASDEIANAIRKFQADCGKPVVVSMGSLAASGGYYVSAPCEWIVANDLTITGSIGVIMSGYNYRGLLDKVGVRPEVFKSGKYKDMLSSTKTPDEISPEERQMVQSLINEVFEKFKGVVRDGRESAFKKNPHTDPKVSRSLSSDWESYADGRILSGTEAKKLGFVDETGDFDTAINRAKSLGHMAKADLIQYQPKYPLGDLLRMFGKSDAKGVKIDIGMDIPKVQAGYMYFLSPTYLH